MLDTWRQALKLSKGRESKYKVLVAAITDDVESGRLVELQRLPSQRRVAQALGISGQTVTNAYQELERQGVLSCEIGRGTFVSKRITKHLTTWILDEESKITDLSTAKMIHTIQHETFWRETCEEINRESEQPWLRACRPIAGFASHRRAAGLWLEKLGIKTDPNRIAITNGATQAIFLALASVAGHGDLVLCDRLTDHCVIGCARVLGFTLKGLDSDTFGIMPDEFEDICGSENVAAIVCTPNLNNPTASLMPEQRRKEIASIAKRYGVYVIEDDVYGPILAKDNPPPISSYVIDQAFYFTSMTKSILTGMRVGYLAIPEKMANRTESVLRVNSWMALPFMGEVASRWIVDGRAEHLLELQRTLVSARQEVAKAYLKNFIIGYHPLALVVWLKVPSWWQTGYLVMRLRELEIAVTSAEPFTVPGTRPPEAIRITIGADYSDEHMRQTFSTIADVMGNTP